MRIARPGVFYVIGIALIVPFLPGAGADCKRSAASSAMLTFTVLQSANLWLSTTPPEAVAAAIRWYLAPLRLVGAPVDELALTLLLSLQRERQLQCV